MNFLPKPNPNFLNKKIKYLLLHVLEYVGVFDELERDQRLKFLNIGYNIFKDNHVSKYNFNLFHITRIILRLASFFLLLFIIGNQIVLGHELYHNYNHTKEFNLIFSIFCTCVGLIMVSGFLFFRNGILSKTIDIALLFIKQEYLNSLMVINSNDDSSFKQFENLVYYLNKEIINENNFNFKTEYKNFIAENIVEKHNISEIKSIDIESKTILPILNLSENSDLGKVSLVEKKVIIIPYIQLLNAENSKILFEFLIPFFGNDSELQLKNLILENILPERPLIFKGNAKQLVDIFLQLDETGFIKINSKTDLIKWIEKNFHYSKNNKEEARFSFYLLNRYFNDRST